MGQGGGVSVTHVVAGLAKESGGPSYSVPALSAALIRGGVKVCLRSVAGGELNAQFPSDLTPSFHAPQRLPIPGNLCFSPDLYNALVADASSGSILHAHGLWLMPNLYPAWAKRKSGGKALIVHAPRGMLGKEALRISRWKKVPFWWLFQHSALAAADCIHATAMSEYEEIRDAGIRVPVAVVPNGIDLPDLSDMPRKSAEKRVALSLGRIHPKKGLDRLVHAWVQIEPEFPDWTLRMVGPAELNHDEELRKLAASLGAQRIHVEGPVYGRAKTEAYRAAELFLLPTLNENFAMTVAEALAAEVPVISTKGAPWAGLQTHRCGWWIEKGVAPLANALRTALALPQEELKAMGERGRDWMLEDFSWKRISAEMIALYHWLKTAGPAPDFVRMN
jgi:glycosyltransferase involved in cell wall biosynthesis